MPPLLVPFWFLGCWWGSVWQHRAGRQGPEAEPVGCCLKPHSGDPPLSFQFVPISSPALPPSTLTMATSAGRPMPT